MFCIEYNHFTSSSKWADYTDIFTAMKFALETQYNQSKNDFKFRLTLANIDTVDAYKLTRIICRQVRNCIFFPISFGETRNFDTSNLTSTLFFPVSRRDICSDGNCWSRILWHPSFLRQCIWNAVCDALVSWVHV